jgi:hypothetical protein
MFFPLLLIFKIIIYYISNTKMLFSSFLILHLFIRKDLLIITQLKFYSLLKKLLVIFFNLNIDKLININD